MGHFYKMPHYKPKVARWSLYPELHNDVSAILEPELLLFSFNHNDTDKGTTESYDTNVVGTFTCTNNKCKGSTWISGVIPITIRMYSNNRYNARVYYQQCRRCRSTCVPTLDHTYAERVAYRIKKWNGVVVESKRYFRKETPPHREDLCHGCKAGTCKKSPAFVLRFCRFSSHY